MRRILACIVVLLNMSMAIYSQGATKKDLMFIYVDHEVTTPVNKLCNDLKELRDDAIEQETSLVIYLSNDIHPMVSFTNLPDINNEYSGDDVFNDIIGALQESHAHDVNSQTDLNLIMKILDDIALVDDNNQLGYREATLEFYVGPTFWNLNNNENLLGRLYFAMEFDELTKGNLYFNVKAPKGVSLTYYDGMPYGIKNVNGINKCRIAEF